MGPLDSSTAAMDRVRAPSDQSALTKSAIFLVLSLAVLRWYLDVPAVPFLMLIAFLSVIHHLLARMEDLPAPIRSRYCALLIVSISVLWGLRRLLPIASSNTFNFTTVIGFSYLFLKLISYILRRQADDHCLQSWTGFLSYCLFAPTWVAGPIMEPQEFEDQLSQRLSFAQHADLALQGAKRIIIGLFKVRVLARLLSSYTFYAIAPRELLACKWPVWLVVTDVTALHLYLNFSGYSDVAIGCSQCLGITVLENFSYPFAARNLEAFWKRWHISFARWLKTYLFLPINKALLNHQRLSLHPVVVAEISIFITFTLMGIWHGFETHYVIYGMWQGAGLLTVIAWRQGLKTLGVHEAYMRNPIIHLVAIFLTFHYFALSLLIFFADNPEKTWTLLHVARRVVGFV